MSDEDYKQGYREGFKDGFEAARKSVSSPVQYAPNVFPNTPWNITCGGTTLKPEEMTWCVYNGA